MVNGQLTRINAPNRAFLESLMTEKGLDSYNEAISALRIHYEGGLVCGQRPAPTLPVALAEAGQVAKTLILPAVEGSEKYASVPAEFAEVTKKLEKANGKKAPSAAPLPPEKTAKPAKAPKAKKEKPAKTPAKAPKIAKEPRNKNNRAKVETPGSKAVKGLYVVKCLTCNTVLTKKPLRNMAAQDVALKHSKAPKTADHKILIEAL